MMEEVPQSLLILVDPDQFGEHPLVEMVPVPRSEVAESAIFQPRPYLFHRVELRRVRRKQFQAQTPMVCPFQAQVRRTSGAINRPLSSSRISEAPCRRAFFLMRGHSVASQAAMTFGLLSRATRWGFCGDKPR